MMQKTPQDWEHTNLGAKIEQANKEACVQSHIRNYKLRKSSEKEWEMKLTS